MLRFEYLRSGLSPDTRHGTTVRALKCISFKIYIAAAPLPPHQQAAVHRNIRPPCCLMTTEHLQHSHPCSKSHIALEIVLFVAEGFVFLRPLVTSVVQRLLHLCVCLFLFSCRLTALLKVNKHVFQVGTCPRFLSEIHPGGAFRCSVRL